MCRLNRWQPGGQYLRVRSNDRRFIHYGPLSGCLCLLCFFLRCPHQWLRSMAVAPRPLATRIRNTPGSTMDTTHLRNHAQSIQNSKIQTSDACHGSQGPKFCPL